MIGDRLDTDILFGRRAGFRTLLVCETGVNGIKDMMVRVFLFLEISCLIIGYSLLSVIICMMVMILWTSFRIFIFIYILFFLLISSPSRIFSFVCNL